MNQVQERIADSGHVAAWTLVGSFSWAQLNEVLQAIAFIAAIACSIAATRYYTSKRHRKNKED